MGSLGRLPWSRRISSTPAYQLVAEAIERRILSGGIRPGEPIGTEAELVKQFGVNRSTVREGSGCSSTTASSSASRTAAWR